MGRYKWFLYKWFLIDDLCNREADSKKIDKIFFLLFFMLTIKI